MKKLLLTPVLTLLAFAALAQTPVAQPTEQPRPEKIHSKHMKPAKGQPTGEEHPATANASNHGQEVSPVATGTSLTGADKGEVISAAAQAKRNGSNNAADAARAPQRSARGRSATSGHAHAAAANHGAGHRASAGHRGH